MRFLLILFIGWIYVHNNLSIVRSIMYDSSYYELIYNHTTTRVLRDLLICVVLPLLQYIPRDLLFLHFKIWFYFGGTSNRLNVAGLLEKGIVFILNFPTFNEITVSLLEALNVRYMKLVNRVKWKYYHMLVMTSAA
ncbi:hypothetical protein BDB01DRAFT_894279 [Pilobolus umbonatus]|nr:hypothetical protein BDB01DRAFT_894279 [Pilobolus umbonatus]